MAEFEKAVRRRLGLTPLERTAVVATGRSTHPVGDDSDDGEMLRYELVNRLTKKT